MFDPPAAYDDLESQAVEIREPEVEVIPAGVPIDRRWGRHVIDINGHELQVRRPNPEALQSFSMAVSKFSPSGIQTEMISLFVSSHMSPESYEALLVRMMDPDDTTVSMDDLGEIMRKIATLGTARPIGP